MDKPLKRVIYITLQKEKPRVRYQVMYEKIPRFCEACSVMGHKSTECGDGVWEEKDLNWGGLDAGLAP